MTSPEPYLIAHIVRGQPAFDIAERMPCPNCEAIRQGLDESSPGCNACDYEGHWWIIPTSGHRAYPYWSHPLLDLYSAPNEGSLNCREMIGSDEAPPNWPDHYAPSAAPRGQGLISNLAERLGLIPKPPTITRR